jgi:hypothetical protein
MPPSFTQKKDSSYQQVIMKTSQLSPRKQRASDFPYKTYPNPAFLTVHKINTFLNLKKEEKLNGEN